ncbi:Hypothetical protein ABZS17D1_03728 [Kosakonia cowanii]
MQAGSILYCASPSSNKDKTLRQALSHKAYFLHAYIHSNNNFS